jgi:hypothetical protein
MEADHDRATTRRVRRSFREEGNKEVARLPTDAEDLPELEVVIEKTREKFSKKISTTGHCYFVDLVRKSPKGMRVKLSELYVGGRTSF